MRIASTRVRFLARGFLLAAATALLAASCQPPGTTPTVPGPPANANGQAFVAFGGNSLGQLGDGSLQQRLAPVSIALANARQIAAGGQISVALTADGRVLQWGNNTLAPTIVAGVSDVRQVAAGDRHVLAVTRSGVVYAWGDNNRGQLGDGTTTPRTTPVQVANLVNGASVAAGPEHSLAIKSDLSVWTWGANTDGQLGDTTKSDRSLPVQVLDRSRPGQPRALSAITLAASGRHSIALTSDVRVVGWGSNASCQLGPDPRANPFDPVVCSERLSPSQIYAATGSASPRTQGQTIAATTHATLIVLSDGSVIGVGGAGGTAQQFGLCQVGSVLGPVLLDIAAAAREVSGGYETALILTAQGKVWSLGRNLAGQAGLGTVTGTECPQEVTATAVKGAAQVAAGKEHSLVLASGVLRLAPASIDFGDQPITTSSAARSIALANDGPAAVTIYDVRVASGGPFTATNTCPLAPAALAAGAQCTLGVTFLPGAAGAATGALRLSSDGFAAPQEIALAGRGTEGAVDFMPTQIDFGSVQSGTTSPVRTVRLRSVGSGPLTIVRIETTLGFTITRDPCVKAPSSIPVQADCTIDVAFAPTLVGVQTGKLRVTYQPNNRSAQIDLEGTGR